MSSPSSEWTKALITAAVGFVFGALAQPLTFALTSRLRVRATRDALYSDLGRVYHIFSRVFDVSPTAEEPATDQQKADRLRAKSFILDYLDKGTFEYYSATEAAAFWSMPEAPAMVRLYGRIGEILRTVESAPWVSIHDQITRVFRQFNRFLMKVKLTKLSC